MTITHHPLTKYVACIAAALLLLLGAATALGTTAGPRLLDPPLSSFTFPQEGTYRSDSIAALVGTDHGVRTYQWNVQLAGAQGNLTAMYWLNVAPSTARAAQDNTQTHHTMENATRKVTEVVDEPLLAGSIAASDGTAGWRFYAPAVGCNATAGATYGNLTFMVVVSSDDAQDSCYVKSERAGLLLDDLVYAAHQDAPAQGQS